MYNKVPRLVIELKTPQEIEIRNKAQVKACIERISLRSKIIELLKGWSE